MAASEGENSKEIQENHWVFDLFPTKFSRTEFFRNDSLEERSSKYQLASDFYSKIYSKVILEETSKKIENNEKLKTTLTNQRKHYSTKEKSNAPEELKEEKKMLWTAQDFQIFKMSYNELRERTIWLLCVIENRNLKIGDLKNELNKNEHLNKALQDRISELSYENSQLRASASTHMDINKSLEEQLQFYEEANNILKDKFLKLRKENGKIEKEKERKSKAFHEYRQKTETTVENLKKDLKKTIDKLSSDYEKKIFRLENTIAELEIKLKEKDTECNNCKNSISILEKHIQATFMTQNVKKEVPQTSNYEKFLNVTDI